MSITVSKLLVGFLPFKWTFCGFDCVQFMNGQMCKCF